MRPESGTPSPHSPFSLYIHIPYCGQRCPYCDFNTYVEAKIPETTYTEALLAELRYRAQLPSWRGRKMQSIFFGGGTPSLFQAESLGAVVSAAREHFPNDAIEISIEVNPGTVTREYFATLKEQGINRISIGAQSFNPRSLRELGRAHSVEQTLEASAAVRAAGIENLNLDLIYALPHQTVSDFECDVRDICAQSPDHISAYQLTIEKGTPFSFRFHQGDLPLPLEEETVAMMEYLSRALADAGYAQYEISNFASPDKRCRHNQAYWDGDDYLGIGAGAHSYCSLEGDGFGRRWSNFALPKDYIERALSSGVCESWRDVLSRDARRFEFFFLGLRRSRGVSVTEYASRFNSDLLTDYREALESLQRNDLLCHEGDLIFLSERGRLLSDSVFQEFIVDE